MKETTSVSLSMEGKAWTATESVPNPVTSMPSLSSKCALDVSRDICPGVTLSVSGSSKRCDSSVPVVSRSRSCS